MLFGTGRRQFGIFIIRRLVPFTTAPPWLVIQGMNRSRLTFLLDLVFMFEVRLRQFGASVMCHLPLDEAWRSSSRSSGTSSSVSSGRLSSLMRVLSSRKYWLLQSLRPFSRRSGVCCLGGHRRDEPLMFVVKDASVRLGMSPDARLPVLQSNLMSQTPRPPNSRVTTYPVAERPSSMETLSVKASPSGLLSPSVPMPT